MANKILTAHACGCVSVKDSCVCHRWREAVGQKNGTRSAP